METPGVSSLGVPGVPWHTQILADQLALFQPRGTDYANLITTGIPGFSDLLTALDPLYVIYKNVCTKQVPKFHKHSNFCNLVNTILKPQKLLTTQMSMCFAVCSSWFYFKFYEISLLSK